MLHKTSVPVGRRTAASWLVVLCAGTLALSAYGLGATAAGAKVSAATAVTVKTAKVNGVGTVLVDSNGKTLYTHTNGTVAAGCDSTCVGAWPPLVVASGTKVKGAKGVTGLATAVDGMQVTVKGLPLYTFAGDSAVHQANGNNLNSFGGVWKVVTVKAPKKTSTTKSSRGYSY